MAEDTLAQALREALWIALQLGGPPLLALLAVGLAISVVQALTQIQEATLSFVPKLVTAGVVILFVGPFAVGVLRAYTQTLFDRIVALGGAP